MCHKRARGRWSRSRSPALVGTSWAEADAYVTHALADIVPVAVTRPGGFSEPWRNPQIAVFTASERTQTQRSLDLQLGHAHCQTHVAIVVITSTGLSPPYAV